MRNLDQIQEDDRDQRTPRAVTLTLLAVGAACAMFAGYVLPGRKSTPVKAPDPLGELVAQRAHATSPAAPAATDLSPHDVTFPGILSDADKTTTALAAVRSNAFGAASLAQQNSPPPPTDRLRVVPLPAQNVLEATPIVTR
ncbi:MAG: SPOR domain-containing protein, partial [Polyangiaceae bacterium]